MARETRGVEEPKWTLTDSVGSGCTLGTEVVQPQGCTHTPYLPSLM